ncbi:MAG: lipoprotein, partial [Bacteroidales bacterium]|nr:lipoprotein [Bacteroidales bacterium]
MRRFLMVAVCAAVLAACNQSGQ